MQAKDVIRATLDSSDRILKMYVGDLTDEEIVLEPAPGVNPVALQLGHLVSAERMFVEFCRPNSCPALPEGFADKHSLKTGDPKDRTRYTTKAEYLRLWDAQRAATKAALDALPDADLDKPSPERFASFAPTFGAMLNLAGGHALSHLGQFVPLRRKLGKPIAF